MLCHFACGPPVQADRGGDGFLTLQEMLNHPHAFYQTVEDHENEPVHDEF